MSIAAISPIDSNDYLSQAGPGRSFSKYLKGQVVFAQGDPADAVFYIRTGKICVTVTSGDGRQAVVAILSARDFFGEGCLADQLQRTATAAVLADSVILRLEKANMTRALRDEPAFSWLFTSYLLTRNLQYEEDLIDQLLNSSEKRLARRLLILANVAEDAGADPVINKISQELLAEMIGTTRSRVNFFMNKFRRMGFIDYNDDSNDGLHIHNSLRSIVRYE
jgi:CRP/FNR family cyclic AMP-dependent transcriptional regulator